MVYSDFFTLKEVANRFQLHMAGFSDLCVRRVIMQLSRPSPVKVL